MKAVSVILMLCIMEVRLGALYSCMKDSDCTYAKNQECVNYTCLPKTRYLSCVSQSDCKKEEKCLQYSCVPKS